MDIIQRTMLLFSGLLEKIRTIGELLKTDCLPVLDEVQEKKNLFWIFNV